MAYATLADLVPRYRPITTMIGSGEYDVSSTEVASVFIQDAEALIDSMLAVKYVTPLTSSNKLITTIACDLATHAMLCEKLPSVPEFMQGRYDRAMEMLKQLVSGQLRLNSETLVGSAGDSFAWSSTTGRHPVFSPVLSDADQLPDTNRVIEELTARQDDLPVQS